jgi:hypothetical protein
LGVRQVMHEEGEEDFRAGKRSGKEGDRYL